MRAVQAAEAQHSDLGSGGPHSGGSLPELQHSDPDIVWQGESRLQQADSRQHRPGREQGRPRKRHLAPFSYSSAEQEMWAALVKP